MIAWLVLVALALHSFVPVGYMPDFSGHGLLVMCDGMDHAANHAGEMDHCPHHKKICPFSAAAIDGFKGPHAPALASPAPAASAALFFASLRLASHSDFGNASPRSPPSFS